LVNAAAVIGGGITDDSFKYFCDWLISEGRGNFERCLANADDLANIASIPFGGLESYGYAAAYVFARKGCKKWEYSDLIDFDEVKGEGWPEEETARRLPRLQARYRGSA
jgi:hypothetical protein